MQNNQTFALPEGICCFSVGGVMVRVLAWSVVDCKFKYRSGQTNKLSKSKDGDHHQEMNCVVFLEWFENQLMPALINPSLIVLDNASYHNVKRVDLSQIITPIIDNRHLIVQNSSIIIYFFISISKINESYRKFRL
jgi:hypothetical protein